MTTELINLTGHELIFGDAKMPSREAPIYFMARKQDATEVATNYGPVSLVEMAAKSPDLPPVEGRLYVTTQTVAEILRRRDVVYPVGHRLESGAMIVESLRFLSLGS